MKRLYLTLEEKINGLLDCVDSGSATHQLLYFKDTIVELGSTPKIRNSKNYGFIGVYLRTRKARKNSFVVKYILQFDKNKSYTFHSDYKYDLECTLNHPIKQVRNLPVIRKIESLFEDLEAGETCRLEPTLNRFYRDTFVLEAYRKMSDINNLSEADRMQRLSVALGNISVRSTGPKLSISDNKSIFFNRLRQIFSRAGMTREARIAGSIYLNKIHDIEKQYNELRGNPNEVSCVQILKERTGLSFSTLGEVLGHLNRHSASHVARGLAAGGILETFVENLQKGIVSAIRQTDIEHHCGLSKIADMLYSQGYFNGSLIAKGLQIEDSEKVSEEYLSRKKKYEFGKIDYNGLIFFGDIERGIVFENRSSPLKLVLALYAASLVQEPASQERRLLRCAADSIAWNKLWEWQVRLYEKLSKSHTIRHSDLLGEWSCRECQNRKYINDFVRAEVVCTSCGLVYPYVFTDNKKLHDLP